MAASQGVKPVAANGKVRISGPSRLVKGAASLMKRGTTTAIPPHLGSASLRIALTAFCLGTVAGLVFPRALSILSTTSWQRYSPDLNQTFSSKGEEAVWKRPQLHLYLLAWSLFHLLEFVITARWNNTRLFSDCKSISVIL
jgi:protein-S-isoprenylcysteine O-methyltransferase